MALLQSHPYKGKPLIDLNGPEGNAFALLGTAHRVCAQVGIEFEPIEKDMKSGNYRHLVQTFDRHFGHLFDIVLPDNWSNYE